jgi:hypothetical protein
MKLWLLKLKSEYYGDYKIYDYYDSFVIRAETEIDARSIAFNNAGDESGEVWKDPEKSTCEELQAEGKVELVLGSYNAG